MFLPPGHILDLSPENKLNSIYITSPTGKKIVIDTDKGVVSFNQQEEEETCNYDDIKSIGRKYRPEPEEQRCYYGDKEEDEYS